MKSFRTSVCRTKAQALSVYLFWLKTGLDQKNIATIFQIDTQQEVSRILAQVRDCLMRDFVPENLGAKALERSEWIMHNSYISKQLFNLNDGQLMLIADGTYCYCQKSSNNLFQRKSYSVQKKAHLVKPFVICATDGQIVDIYGLFEATKNDARILSEILASDVDLKSILQPNDVFLLDRGFSDCREELKQTYNLDSQMPSLIQESTQKSQQAKTSKQLDTIEANKTRLVTKVRWVIEVVNSFLKKSFKALSDVPNKTLVHTLIDYKIAAALINRFFHNLFSDPDDQVLIA